MFRCLDFGKVHPVENQRWNLARFLPWNRKRGWLGSPPEFTTSGQLNISNGQTGLYKCPEAESEARNGFYGENRV